MRSRAAALIAIALLTGAACQKDTASFRDYGLAFEYPEDWSRIRAESSGIAEASPRWTAAVGVDGGNLVSLGAYHLAFPVTRANFERFADDLTTRVTRAAREAGGQLVEGAETTTLGGLPALGFRISGDERENRVVVAFDRTTEYLLECRSTADLHDEINEGCDQVVESFERRP